MYVKQVIVLSSSGPGPRLGSAGLAQRPGPGLYPKRQGMESSDNGQVAR